MDPGETIPTDSDSDGDGLSDGVERETTKTDPTDPDTDDDGLCDGPSAVYGDDGTSLLCMAGEDVNANGFVDAGETDPNNPDTDGDGVLDGDEVAAGTDPTMPSLVPTHAGGGAAASDCGAGSGSTEGALLLCLVLFGIAVARRRIRT